MSNPNQSVYGQERQRLTRWSKTGKAALTTLLIGCCMVSLPAAAQDCEVKIGTVGPMSGGTSAEEFSFPAGLTFISNGKLDGHQPPDSGRELTGCRPSSRRVSPSADPLLIRGVRRRFPRAQRFCIIFR